MIITCCCCTFRRPKQVGGIIHMFQRQTHKDKRLFIIDDGQSFMTKAKTFDNIREDWATGCREQWILHSCHTRFKSLGEKRNRCVDFAIDIFPETEAIAVMDDDDLYLPWHLEAANAALENADWSLPSEVLYRNDDGTYRRHLTSPGKFFHGGMAFRLPAFIESGGYPDKFSAWEDQSLFLRLEAIRATICDPVALTGKPPSYVFNPYPNLMHISGYLKPNDTGEYSYALLGQQPCEPCELAIAPPPFEIENPVILETTHPRPF